MHYLPQLVGGPQSFGADKNKYENSSKIDFK